VYQIRRAKTLRFASYDNSVPVGPSREPLHSAKRMERLYKFRINQTN